MITKNQTPKPVKSEFYYVIDKESKNADVIGIIFLDHADEMNSSALPIYPN